MNSKVTVTVYGSKYRSQMKYCNVQAHTNYSLLLNQLKHYTWESIMSECTLSLSSTVVLSSAEEYVKCNTTIISIIRLSITKL